MALNVCDLHMEEWSPMTTATSGAPNVLGNDVPRLQVATYASYDMVSNVCVEGNLLQIPLSSYRVCTHDCKAFCHTISFLNLFQDYQMSHVQHSNLQLQMVSQGNRPR